MCIERRAKENLFIYHSRGSDCPESKSSVLYFRLASSWFNFINISTDTDLRENQTKFSTVNNYVFMQILTGKVKNLVGDIA